VTWTLGSFSGEMGAMRGLIERIERGSGVPDLVGFLSERIAPSELTSLLLEVAARQRARTTPGRVLQPLGACSAVATVSQNKIVSTMRSTEMLSDATNVLALECAKRRKKDRKTPVLLAASQRVVRAQALPGPNFSAHFRLFSMVAAGRDEGSFRFEARQLVTQLGYYLALFTKLGLTKPRVAITPLAGRAFEEAIIAPLAERFPEARIHLDLDRSGGRGYYEEICFKLFATNKNGEEMEVGDGGSVPWTRKLLSDEKERLIISGLGVERLLT